MASVANAGRWGELGLGAASLACIEELGFDQLMPVQKATIPLFLGHKDVAVEACTGSGKTLAFVVPVMEMLARVESEWKPREVGAILLAPTRELATQVKSVVDVFAAKHAVHAVLLVGGTDAADDEKRFCEGGNVVVATPGRLEAFVKRMGARFNVRKLEALVMDEADRLLDLGFEESINSLLRILPKQRRTGLFSATQTQQVTQLIRAGLRNPVRVTVREQRKKRSAAEAAAAAPAPTGSKQSTPAGLTNLYTVCESEQKLGALVDFLRRHARKQKCMVFLLTCACVDLFERALPQLRQLKGIPIAALHGRMPQGRRTRTYDKFVAQSAGVLLCTDVAARGLDIPDVEWIVQFDPPQDPDAFVHRVGRTARAGRSGGAVVYLHPHEDAYVNFLHVRKVPIVEQPLPDTLPNVLGQWRRAVLHDRDIMEKGIVAFASFVRAYRNHKCSYIFPIDKLNLGRLANLMGLMRLPRMPELRARPQPDFDNTWCADVRPSDVRYRDKVRERARQARVAKEEAAGRMGKDDAAAERRKRPRQVAWSRNKDKRELKLQRAEKKRRRATHAALRAGSGGGGDGAAAAVSNEAAEWEALKREVRLKKKVQAGKITAAQMEAELAKLHAPAEPQERSSGSGGRGGGEDAAAPVAEGTANGGVATGTASASRKKKKKPKKKKRRAVPIA